MNPGFLTLLALFACRPEPGAPRYPEREALDPAEGDGFLVTPLADGETRLGIGAFYEGPTTASIPIDDTTSHFYVYENSFSVATTDERVEGYTADVLTLTGKPWWGGGIHWDVPQDLSDYDTLHFALRTSDLVAWNVGIKGGAEGRVAVADLGLTTDGEWHRFEVPLADFDDRGVDLTKVTVGLLLVGEGGADGASVAIDDVYFQGGTP